MYMVYMVYIYTYECSMYVYIYMMCICVCVDNICIHMYVFIEKYCVRTSVYTCNTAACELYKLSDPFFCGWAGKGFWRVE